jgi:hypothetical protein
LIGDIDRQSDRDADRGDANDIAGEFALAFDRRAEYARYKIRSQNSTSSPEPRVIPTQSMRREIERLA